MWAVLRNRTDYPLQIEGRSQFFDADQVPIEEPSAWKRVHLPPNAVGTYRESSTKVEAIAPATRVAVLGIPDEMYQHATRERQLEEVSLTAEGIASRVRVCATEESLTTV